VRQHQPRRALTIPNQSLVAGVVDVMEELLKFTLLTRDVLPYMADRHPDRGKSAEALSRQVKQRRLQDL
jgi:hypothetical protein